MAGIEHSVEFFKDLSKLVITGVDIAKSGMHWWDILPKIMPLLSQLKEVVEDAKGAMPELQDLDKDEVLKIGQAAYDCIKDVVRAVV